MTTLPDLHGRILMFACMLDVVINILHFYSQKCLDSNDNYVIIISQEQIGQGGLDRKVEFK